jgi:hypothetical protein
MSSERPLLAWPEEEATPRARPVSVLAVGGMRPRRQPRVRRIAVMRGIGPHVAWYMLLGALLPLVSLCVLGMLISFIQGLF